MKVHIVVRHWLLQWSCGKIMVFRLVYLTCLNLSIGRSSVDWDSNNNCHWNAESRHGRSCHLCTEVVGWIMICLLFIVLLSRFGASLCLVVLSSWPSGFIYFSDPEDRLTPRPVLARFDLKCSICLHNLTACLGQKKEKKRGRSSNIYHLFASPLVVLYLPYISNRTPEEVLAAKGVKPTLSPNLNTLALVEVLSITCINNEIVPIHFSLCPYC